MPDPYLAVVAIVKDEALYLREWAAFHRLVGVEHFFIYDNGSTDDTVRMLGDMPDVTVRHWPGACMQLPAYGDALARGGARWLAFIDADEFLFSTAYVPLSVILREFEDDDALAACWATFGTSNVPTHQPDTLRSYVRRAPETAKVNRLVRSIVQPQHVPAHAPATPHYFRCKTVDEHHRPLSGPFADRPTWDRIRVNHYHSRSIAEARAKQQRPRADNGQLRTTQLVTDEWNAVYDVIVLPYADILDAKLGRGEWEPEPVGEVGGVV